MLNETKITVNDSVLGHVINENDEILKLAKDYDRDVITTISYLIASHILTNCGIDFYEANDGTIVDILADGIRYIDDQGWIIDQYNKLYPDGSLS
jgi:hypothetical protein